ncbi:MAG: transketolase C-terminal domain-containing protein [Patescibacteria group bacterium]
MNSVSNLLNPNIFKDDVEQIAIRKGFGEGLVIAGEKDNRVVGLCADLTESTQMLAFKNKFPKRFIEIGVAEQNMASVASGMAAMGKVPVISSYGMFSPGRNWEQIRTTIAYNDRKVLIAGNHTGLSVGPDGGTHQAIEDIALMRVIPNMTVIAPCDAIEAKKATVAALADAQKTPVYIRLARESSPVITTEETPFEIGKAIVLHGDEYKSSDTLICSTGALTFNALKAAKILEEMHGRKVVVIHFPTIKPLDTKTLIEYAEHTLKVITVEEHQIAAGFGSAICEALSEASPKKVIRIGVQDQFGQSGTPKELIAHYGMNVEAIVAKSL